LLLRRDAKFKVAAGFAVMAKLGREDVTAANLNDMRDRIGRAFGAVKDASGPGYQISFQTTGTEFITNFQAIGVKGLEQSRDDFLNLFIWTWNLKDYLKSGFEARGLSRQEVENQVNQCSALKYVADIANRAKHGSLRESRSGQFAELVNVGHKMAQDSIEQITVTGSDVILHTKNSGLIQIYATVATNNGTRLDALAVLNDAMACWETRVIPQIATNYTAQAKFSP
jgi:hypothetical protein